MTGRAFAARLMRFLSIRGLIAAPGAISLSGLGVAAATLAADRAAPGLAAAHGFGPETSRAVFSTLAGAAMTALGLVYSITLVVFTLAASALAPRLLERFAEDRLNQVAIGALGALFLHALAALIFSPDGPSLAPVAAAGIMALLAVLLLLVFVDRVAKRITIDEEIAAIAAGLDRRIEAAAARSGGLARGALVLPEGPEAPVLAPVSGYLNALALGALAEAARAQGGALDFAVAPGEHVLKGDVVARALGPRAEALAAEAAPCLSFGGRRTEEGDLRFSVSLLLEIALRALSPGVNDSFTAIAVIDRLSASLALAADAGLNPGIVCDTEGAARVILPRGGQDELIRYAFGPIRRCCRDNLLVARAALAALRRLAPRLEVPARAEAERQIALILAEAEAGPALREDLEGLRAG